MNMRDFVLDLFLIGLITVMIPSATKAQLFETNELYPNTSVIKGKYFHGTGGGGYWSLDYLDSTGRIIIRDSYHKKQFMSGRKIVFDDHNNKIFDIQTFPHDNHTQADTIRYQYTYANNRIIYQFRKLSENDSTATELIENQGDTLLKYQEKAFYFRPKTKTTDVYETHYTLRYRGDNLMSTEVFDKDKKSTEIEKYEYNDDGRLKWRCIETLPKSEQESFYLGGPGNDDEVYQYKLDSQGRIRKFYKTINGKKFKMAVYRYH